MNAQGEKPSTKNTFNKFIIKRLKIDILQQFNDFEMRTSPINNLKNARQAELESRIRDRSHKKDLYSPQRLSMHDIEYWKQKSRTLQAEMLELNEEIAVKNRRLIECEQMEDKIELLLAQNTHLADQNQNLINLIHQKKTETEIWKSKFEGEYNHSNTAQAEKRKIFDQLNLKDQEHQVQIDKLLNEISNLHNQMEDLQNLKQIQINTLKNRYENEAMNQIQSLKRSQYSNTELQELAIRKLKDAAQQKQFAIQNLRRQSKLENERLQGEISYLKNQIKKIEKQKVHEIDLIKTENENARSNLIRVHKKNQEQLKNLNEIRIKRLEYEIEEKKNQIEEGQGRVKKGGKQNQVELNQLLNEKTKLRIQIKEADNISQKRIMELTKFYETVLKQQRQNTQNRQDSLTKMYNNQISNLQLIINVKEEQVKRLLSLNAEQKKNQQLRLAAIRLNNEQLKHKIEQLVLHYEREVQLMKIKITHLYEADIDALKSNTQNRLAALNRDRDNLKELLKDTWDKLSTAVQDKLDLRKEYENRLTQFKITYERQHQQLQDLLAIHEKQIQNQTSKVSLTHIEHNKQIQNQSFNKKQLINQKRQLETMIENKNKQIDSLNQRIQKMESISKKQIDRLKQQLENAKNEHQAWLGRQTKENQQWGQQRGQLKEKNHQINLKLNEQITKHKKELEKINNELEQKKIKIAQQEGLIVELEKKCGMLHEKSELQAGNIEKTHMQTEALMNEQKTKFLTTKQREIKLIESQFTSDKKTLEKQNQGLKDQNQILRDINEKMKVNEAELGIKITELLESVNKRSELEERVINIGISNNYFKNVAEIFKKTLQQ